jgi:hypothetical protein
MAATGFVLSTAACASQQQIVGQKEDLLAAAGFLVRVADTPQRLAAMKSLPPNKFVMRVVNGQPLYAGSNVPFRETGTATDSTRAT